MEQEVSTGIPLALTPTDLPHGLMLRLTGGDTEANERLNDLLKSHRLFLAKTA